MTDLDLAIIEQRQKIAVLQRDLLIEREKSTAISMKLQEEREELHRLLEEKKRNAKSSHD
jgi:Holliday junction resolvase